MIVSPGALVTWTLPSCFEPFDAVETAFSGATFATFASAALPVSFFGRRSTSIRWLSVPPATMSKPPARIVSASARAFSTTERA